MIWFSANLKSGNRRWAAVYEYQKQFYGQTTDAGQTRPFSKLSGAFGAMISDVDIYSLQIEGTSMPTKNFIQLLRKQLRSAKDAIDGLSSERIAVIAKKISSSSDIGIRKAQAAELDEFLNQREMANEVGSN